MFCCYFPCRSCERPGLFREISCKNAIQPIKVSHVSKLNMEAKEFVNSKIDCYGFEHSENTDFKTYEEFMTSYLRILAHRAARWNEMIGQNGLVKSRTLKRFCRKGIPAEYRTEVWMQTSEANKRMREQPELYKELIVVTDIQRSTSCYEAIEKDLPRTFPENIHFADVEHDPEGLRLPLKHVLTAIARNNPNIGYCQGMNFVAGLLLLVVKNEEKVFWLFDTLINKIIPDFYAPDMTALKAEQLLLGEIVRWKLPAVYDHMESLGVQWCLIGMKWFICLFADVLPVETVYRVWDCLFYEGSKVLHRVAFTLISLNKDKILACKSFNETVDLFKDIVNNPEVIDCHTFMKMIFKQTGSFPKSRINKMREECLLKVE